jgi:hypothetical protein
MQLNSVFVLLGSFALCFQGSDALARSKLDQYTSDDWLESTSNLYIRIQPPDLLDKRWKLGRREGIPLL